MAETFAQWLHVTMDDRRIAVPQLATRTGLNPVTLYRMLHKEEGRLVGEEGYQHPLPRTLERLAIGLDLTPQERVAMYLAAGRGSPPEPDTPAPPTVPGGPANPESAYILLRAQPDSEAVVRALDGFRGAEAHSVWGEVDAVVRVIGNDYQDIFHTVDHMHEEPMRRLVTSTSTLLGRPELGELGDPAARVGAQGAYVLVTAQRAQISEVLRSVPPLASQVARGSPPDQAALEIVHGTVVMGSYDMVLAVRYRRERALWDFVMGGLQKITVTEGGRTEPAIARTTTLLVAAR